ncbi:hypothetical protein WA026_004117 [Henosepilachna vigintioctopunctata]|uniref:MORN repeat-containing protein 5 n=1 Tax=Henosepilachna vigintioctopunctata TaxID=420089 RepID=A0AAW1UHS0_9CUCU
MINKPSESENNIEIIKFGEMEKKEITKRFDPALQNKYLVEYRVQTDFITGSSYKGKWSPVNMDSIGSYTLLHGVVYRGQLKDGQFHGKGILMYPMGQIILAEFHEGKIISWKCERRNIEQCNLATYCKPPDRRFFATLKSEFLPPRKEYLTNYQPTMDIPTNCYDVGDGFYNPKTLWVHSYRDFSKLLYMPSPKNVPVDENLLGDDGTSFIKKIPRVPIHKSCEWIETNCRKAWDEPTGYKPEYFEYWFSGKKAEGKKLNMRVKSEGGKFEEKASLCENLLKDFERIADMHGAERKQERNFSMFKNFQIETVSDNISKHRKYRKRNKNKIALYRQKTHN